MSWNYIDKSNVNIIILHAELLCRTDEPSIAILAFRYCHIQLFFKITFIQVVSGLNNTKMSDIKACNSLVGSPHM